MGRPGWRENLGASPPARRPRAILGGPPFPPLAFSPWGPPLTPASAARDQLWLLRRISSTDHGRSHTGSDAGARSWSGIVWFICSEKDEKRG